MTLRRLGAFSFMASAALFTTKSILEWVAGAPPAAPELVGWIELHRGSLAWVSEVLFFAAMFLIPAFVALYEDLARRDRVKAIVGCGAAGVAIALLAMTLVVHGRLIFPMFGWSAHTADMAELTFAIYYGGIHAVMLVMAGSTLVLGLAIRTAGGAIVGWLAFLATIADVAASYPDRIGPTPTFACGLVFAAWFAAVGARLWPKVS